MLEGVLAVSHFKTQLRWALGWSSPNEAGAFLVTLLPWIWWLGETFFIPSEIVAMKGRPSRRIYLAAAAFFSEFLVWFVLVKTYSRGALVSAVLSFVLWSALATKARRNSEPRSSSTDKIQARIFIARAALLILLISVSGFSDRLGIDYSTHDKSILNRIALWKGGLELIASSPFQGWGWGNSGAAFMNWIQPFDRYEIYRSMVNSYLTIGVEAGLIVFCAVVTGALFLLFLGLTTASSGNGPSVIVPAVGPSCLFPAVVAWFAWLVVMFFSNLWNVPSLWLLPSISLIVIVMAQYHPEPRSGTRGSILRPALLSLGLAAVSSIAIAALLHYKGKKLTENSAFTLSRTASGDIMLAKSAAVSGPTVVVFPSYAVLGTFYGQELRDLLLAAPTPLRLRVTFHDEVLPSEANTIIVACGEKCASPALQNRRVLLIHPTLAPSAILIVRPQSSLILPELDLAKVNQVWSQWAAEQNSVSVATIGSGLLFEERDRWPEALYKLLESQKPSD